MIKPLFHKPFMIDDTGYVLNCQSPVEGQCQGVVLAVFMCTA